MIWLTHMICSRHCALFCLACDCDPHGSLTLQCDQNNGSCICQTGISGDKCNKCARGFLGQSPYCSPCGECFTNWDRILDENKGKIFYHY